MNKWDERFMKLANEVASWSKDPDCKVGAVVVSPDARQFSFGFNGFPTGISDEPDRLSHPSIKNALTVHAEVNAILNARRNLSDWVMYCTKAPCIDCSLAIIQSGIIRLMCPEIDPESSWAKRNEIALDLLKEASVATEFVLRT